MKILSQNRRLALSLICVSVLALYGPGLRAQRSGLVTRVDAIAITVSDMDRAVDFYSKLTFQKVSEIEVDGETYEHLEGVF